MKKFLYTLAGVCLLVSTFFLGYGMAHKPSETCVQPSPTPYVLCQKRVNSLPSLNDCVEVTVK